MTNVKKNFWSKFGTCLYFSCRLLHRLYRGTNYIKKCSM